MRKAEGVIGFRGDEKGQDLPLGEKSAGNGVTTDDENESSEVRSG